MPKLKNKNLDNYYSKLSNKLSEINQFITYPNPCVGAVIVSDKHVSVAYTGKHGTPHAEYKLLKKKTNFLNGKLFTSLEPCSHKGKNPPCTNIIIKKKIKKIITNSKDEDQRVKGQTKKILKKNNVKIIYKNNPSRSSIIHNYSKKNKLPYVIGKIAISKDGYSKHKNKRLFTSKLALKYAHLLRYQSDSILIGRKTLNDDNPKLNSRINGLEKKLAKFIINPKLNISPKILINRFLRGSYIIHCNKNLKINNSYKKKFKLIYFDFSRPNVSLRILQLINQMGYNKLLIEGGLSTLKSFIYSNLLNELKIIKSNTKFGNKGQIPIGKIANTKKMKLDATISLEDDIILNYKSSNVYRNN